MNRLEPGLTLRMKNEARRIQDQHRRLSELKDEIASALSAHAMQRASEYFDRFVEALEAHFSVEEQLFFPAIHGIDAEIGETVDQLISAHALMRDQMAGLSRVFASGDGRECARQLENLIALLQHHERAEERVMRRASGSD